jgi:hypothetical protein
MESLERRSISPVQVVEDEDQRAARSENVGTSADDNHLGWAVPPARTQRPGTPGAKRTSSAPRGPDW